MPSIGGNDNENQNATRPRKTINQKRSKNPKNLKKIKLVYSKKKKQNKHLPWKRKKEKEKKNTKQQNNFFMAQPKKKDTQPEWCHSSHTKHNKIITTS